MALFSKNYPKNETKKKLVDAVSYFVIDKKVYKFSMTKWIELSEETLDNMELFDKYGFNAIVYDIVSNTFSEYYSTFYESIKDSPFDMSKAVQINGDKDLQGAIRKYKEDFESIFKNFPTDDTLYTHNLLEYGQCFSEIAMVKRKLIVGSNNNEKSINPSAMILEIEVLDGKNANTRRMFIPFLEFINAYNVGCDVNVVGEESYNSIVDCYFADDIDK